jgi:hypothetical protein
MTAPENLPIGGNRTRSDRAEPERPPEDLRIVPDHVIRFACPHCDGPIDLTARIAGEPARRCAQCGQSLARCNRNGCNARMFSGWRDALPAWASCECGATYPDLHNIDWHKARSNRGVDS